MKRGLVAAALGVCCTLAAGLGACGRGGAGEGPLPASNPAPGSSPLSDVESDAATRDPRLPQMDGPFWPSTARVAGPAGAVDVSLLADVEFCARCHEDMFDQWSASAHARSSFDNPWYRVAVDSLRDEAGATASRFCAGCHDPLLLVSGRMDQEEIAPDDPLAHAGVTCMVCHGITETTTDGNGSWVLDTSPVPIPVRGDEASIAAHRDRMATGVLDSAGLCGSCHRGFLSEASGNPHFVPGMDDLGPWRASVYGDTRSARIDDEVEATTCQGCHMPDEAATGRDRAGLEGVLRGHRFAGAQTALARSAADPRQLAAVTDMLTRAATIDVAAVRFADGRVALPADSAPVAAGDAFAFDVVVRNVGAGHRFPGGVRDTQDTWIEVEVRGRDGGLIAEAGTRYRDGEDSTAHRLTTVMLDGQGHPELRHFVQRFAGKGYDHTVGPRDAAVTRYELTLPDGLAAAAFPLLVTARLQHRRHARPMHDAACDASRTPRGRGFSAASRDLGRAALDACATQPVTEIARAGVWIGPGAEGRPSVGDADRPTWQRLYEHALGLAQGVQERTDEARPSIDRALALLGDGGDARGRAMLLVARARADGRQGRLEEALSAAGVAEALIGPHPAIDRARGDAYAQVWRWDDAAAAYGRLVQGAPGDSGGWRAYARALGSGQNDAAALRAARTGLALAPRDEALLRSQALALAAQGADLAPRARDLFLAHRRPDAESALRLACAQEVEGCARDQQPVVTVTMRVR